jgi:hypothetical protein
VKKLVLFQNKAKSCEKLIITLVLGKTSIFFAELCKIKSQKIVIITSTPMDEEISHDGKMHPA